MLTELAEEIRVCTRCALCRRRRNAVPGEGPEEARVVFVGEGPGEQEDIQGRPFVGAAGQFLNELLSEAGIDRQDVFITNIVKCRPPGNRDPRPEEVEACSDWLVGQIAVINPRVVCTLGRSAMHALIDPHASIRREHGKPREITGMLFVPLYHPAAALHQPSLRLTLLEDMRRLRGILEQAAK